MDTFGVWNVILDGDLGPPAPGSSPPATNACCVYTVTELTNNFKKLLYTPIHTQFFTTMRKTNS